MKRIFALAAALIVALNSFAQTDTTRVLLVGNSFTYYNDSWDMLAKIARTNGHTLDIVHTTAPGYSFGDHLNSLETTEAILKGGYDYAVLQDQSQTPAEYAKDPQGKVLSRMHFITMTNRIFGWSPYCKIIMENTWAYPDSYWGGFGSEPEFNLFLENGCRLYAEAIMGKVSPVGQAFTLVRRDGKEINLLDADQKHPSPEGTYLKSCVNYLTIFGGKLSSFTDDCGLDAMTAKYLRDTAAKAVKQLK